MDLILNAQKQPFLEGVLGFSSVSTDFPPLEKWTNYIPDVERDIKYQIVIIMKIMTQLSHFCLETLKG